VADWFELDEDSPYMLLVAGNCWLDKDRQDPGLRKDYKEQFELD
jgi:hypothetical protein